jgi:nicotinamide-nucleotide amidase
MEAWFTGRAQGPAAGGTVGISQIQLRQVRVPAAARVHANPVGLAPGFEIAVAGVPVVCLPGVPRELHGIFDAHLEGRFAELREQRGNVERIARRIYRVFGRGESQISQACRGLVDNVAGATIHYQVKFPETLVKLVVRDRDRQAAVSRLETLDGEIRRRLTGFLYGTGEENLVDKVMRRLIDAKQKVATAESCTGGMVGELLTRRPGSSASFVGGAICYANGEKIRQLGVAQATLDAHGAVSEPTAREMAEGARARFAVDYAVSVTGVAGPDGGTADKPVGTVWLALASPDGTTTKKLAWPGARDQVRTLASWWALKLIDDALGVT